MGYSIFIGNAVLATDEEELTAHYAVEPIALPDAPEWPNPTKEDGTPDYSKGIDISGKGNSRHPGYVSMSNWAKATGLHDLFLGPDGRAGLLHPHPGCQRITKEIADEVTAARKLWESTHPGAKPGWREDQGEDGALAKLIWYEWWMKWAIENCERPAISNT